MAAQRCPNCGINFPIGQAFARCKCCDEPTGWIADAMPDRDWRDSVLRGREPVDQDADRERDLLAWRLSMLLEAGYELEHAEALAGRFHDVDLHYAVELVTVRGCPPPLAVRVLL